MDLNKRVEHLSRAVGNAKSSSLHGEDEGELLHDLEEKLDVCNICEIKGIISFEFDFISFSLIMISNKISILTVIKVANLQMHVLREIQQCPDIPTKDLETIANSLNQGLYDISKVINCFLF